MNPGLQQALVYIVGAVIAAVPATVRAAPGAFRALERVLNRWSIVQARAAKAKLIAAQSASDAVENSIAQLRDVIADRDAKIVQLERRLESMHVEMNDLRKAIAAGGIHR